LIVMCMTQDDSAFNPKLSELSIHFAHSYPKMREMMLKPLACYSYVELPNDELYKGEIRANTITK
jgi:hypothetical protein